MRRYKVVNAASLTCLLDGSLCGRWHLVVFRGELLFDLLERFFEKLREFQALYSLHTFDLILTLPSRPISISISRFRTICAPPTGWNCLRGLIFRHREALLADF